MSEKFLFIFSILTALDGAVGSSEVGECWFDKNKGCSATFNSKDSPDGIIASPCYPSSYPNETVCKYEFVGGIDERVQLNFIDFSLTGNHVQCYYSDTIEIFMFVRQKYQPVQLLCGLNRLPGPILSYNQRMRIEFRGIYGGERETARGFKLNFEFVRHFGIRSGQQIENTCNFNYNSSSATAGSFNSPNFPGIYPINMECNYYFHGSKNETIEIIFSYFDVEGVFPCYGDDVSSDSVEFSNFMSRDRKHKYHCGKVNEPFRVVSDGRFFRVTFRSNDKLDGTGFKASYRFTGTAGVKNRTNLIEIDLSDSAMKIDFSKLLIYASLVRFPNFFGFLNNLL